MSNEEESYDSLSKIIDEIEWNDFPPNTFCPDNDNDSNSTDENCDNFNIEEVASNTLHDSDESNHSDVFKPDNVSLQVSLEMITKWNEDFERAFRENNTN